MKTTNTYFMRKLITAGLTALALMGAVDAQAALLTNWGRATYRDAQKVEGQAIAWEFLNDKLIYAKIKHLETLDEDGKKALCDSVELDNRYGHLLFDVDPQMCASKESSEEHSVYMLMFDMNASKWNYHMIILPTNIENKVDGQIVEIQMGSTINRTPPKLLRVMEKSNTCKDDGLALLTNSHKIICNGWSWESLDQYWNEDVPPELKALNGTGVKKPEQNITSEPVPATQ